MAPGVWWSMLGLRQTLKQLGRGPAGLDVTHQTDMLVLRKACLESGSALSEFVWELCENFISVYHDARKRLSALPSRS